MYNVHIFLKTYPPRDIKWPGDIYCSIFYAGSRHLTKGTWGKSAQIPQLVSRTMDGNLYSTFRTSAAEAIDEQEVIYEVYPFLQTIPSSSFYLFHYY